MSTEPAQLDERAEDDDDAGIDPAVVRDLVVQNNQMQDRLDELETKGGTERLPKGEARAAMFQLAQSVGVESVGVDTPMPTAAKAIADEFEAMTQRIAALEQNVAAISDLGREKTTKEEKIAAMVQFAMNQASDARAERVALTPKEIKGVTGVGLRHAYNYLDELPGEFDFLLDKADVTQYGDLEIDKSSQKRALIVDLEALHSDEQALNKFNNRTDGEGGR